MRDFEKEKLEKEYKSSSYKIIIAICCIPLCVFFKGAIFIVLALLIYAVIQGSNNSSRRQYIDSIEEERKNAEIISVAESELDSLATKYANKQLALKNVEYGSNYGIEKYYKFTHPGVDSSCVGIKNMENKIWVDAYEMKYRELQKERMDSPQGDFYRKNGLYSKEKMEKDILIQKTLKQQLDETLTADQINPWYVIYFKRGETDLRKYVVEDQIKNISKIIDEGEKKRSLYVRTKVGADRYLYDETKKYIEERGYDIVNQVYHNESYIKLLGETQYTHFENTFLVKKGIENADAIKKMIINNEIK